MYLECFSQVDNHGSSCEVVEDAVSNILFKEQTMHLALCLRKGMLINF